MNGSGREETANLFSYTYETVKDGKKETVTFKWITNIELTEKNLEEMIYADISCVESAEERDKPEHKKYILKVIGKFSMPSHNG